MLESHFFPSLNELTERNAEGEGKVGMQTDAL